MSNKPKQITLVDGEWFATEQPVRLPDVRGGGLTYVANYIDEIMYTEQDGQVLTGYKCSRCDYAHTSAPSVRSHAKIHSKIREQAAAHEAEIAALQSTVTDLLETIALLNAALHKLPEKIRNGLVETARRDLFGDKPVNATPAGAVDKPASAPVNAAPETLRPLRQGSQEAAVLAVCQRAGDTFTAAQLVRLLKPGEIQTSAVDKIAVISSVLFELRLKGYLTRVHFGLYALSKAFTSQASSP